MLKFMYNSQKDETSEFVKMEVVLVCCTPLFEFCTELVTFHEKYDVDDTQIILLLFKLSLKRKPAARPLPALQPSFKDRKLCFGRRIRQTACLDIIQKSKSVSTREFKILFRALTCRK